MEHVARMGEWVASADADDVLSCIGLGSCIGLCLVDRRRGVAGLAHIMLPESPTATAPQPGKYADLAVGVLLEEVLALGANRTFLEAALVGGANMFSFGDGGREIGKRNEAAVRARLEELRITVRAAATGGASGRTVWVHPSSGHVVVRVAAGQPEDLLNPPLRVAA